MFYGKIQQLVAARESEQMLCKPQFFRLRNNVERLALEQLIAQKPYIKIFDTIGSQLRELIKTKHPSKTLSDNEIEDYLALHLGNTLMEEYGVWVYYPWSERLVHILDEQEFIEMRTNRNKYKITADEQALLARKKVGVIGLSVGQSVSLTMAMERIFGELRIADFDELEITNLNRLRSSIANMGLHKTILVAREIAEIDPFLKVTCFHEGITDENIESFLLDNGKLDVLIDECDSVDIKINCRVAAKKHHIPVLMEASDRGTIDIERFDLEPDRPILHGFVEHLDISKVKGLKTMEEKLPYILPIVGIESMSPRLKASAVEVGQTINTWPQLASAVTMGGGVTADVCRRMLLNYLTISGRFFIDLDELISNPKIERLKLEMPIPSPLLPEAMKAAAEEVLRNTLPEGELGADIAQRLVKAAQSAPSAGNMQPWKWYYHPKGLFLFHDLERSAALADFRYMTSYLSIGTAIEHVYLEANKEKLSPQAAIFPLGQQHQSGLVAAFNFRQDAALEEDLLAEYFTYRRTNRNPGTGKQLSAEMLQDIAAAAQVIPGARMILINDDNKIARLAKIAGKADKLRIFIEEGHFDMFNKELKFSDEDPNSVKEGLDVRTLDLKPKDQVGFRVIRDLEAIKLVAQWNGGAALESVSHDQVATASAVGIITMPGFTAENMLSAGRAVERAWLMATSHGVAFQPLLASVLHFARILEGGGDGIPENIKQEFLLLHKEFVDIFEYPVENEIPMFFMRFCFAPPPKLTAQRLEMESIFFY